MTTRGMLFDPPMTGPLAQRSRGLLRDAKLRQTAHRIALGRLILGRGNRHVSAESLYREAVGRNIRVSLATVYNTLHKFTQLGLLREIAAGRSHTFFDTNTSPHHHFLVIDTNELLNVPDGCFSVIAAPSAPEGTEVVGIEIIVRLRQIPGTGGRAEGETKMRPSVTGDQSGRVCPQVRGGLNPPRKRLRPTPR